MIIGWRTRRWGVCVVGLLACVGCSEAVTMVQEASSGGIVTYSYREEKGGHLFSPYRKQAFDVISNKCTKGYKIVREGAAQGHRRVGGAVDGAEDESKGLRWGIQFECK